MTVIHPILTGVRPRGLEVLKDLGDIYPTKFDSEVGFQTKRSLYGRRASTKDDDDRYRWNFQLILLVQTQNSNEEVRKMETFELKFRVGFRTSTRLSSYLLYICIK